MPVDIAGMLQRFFGTSTFSQRVGDSTAEPGIDVDLPAGTPVKAVTSGVFVGALSTPNEVVEKILVAGKAVFLDYMHIDPSAFKAGQQIKAGDVVGKVTTKDEPGGTFGNKSYFSTGPHVEFGVYPSGTPVGQDSHPGLDPINWLSDLVGGKLGNRASWEPLGHGSSSAPFPSSGAAMSLDLPMPSPSACDSPGTCNCPATRLRGQRSDDPKPAGSDLTQQPVAPLNHGAPGRRET